MLKPLTETQVSTLGVVQFFQEDPDRWTKEAKEAEN